MKRTNSVLMGSIINEFFQRPYIATKVASGRINELYREVVGEEVARLTSEIKLNGQILNLKLSSSLLRQELFYQREELRTELNRRAKVEFIKSIVVK